MRVFSQALCVLVFLALAPQLAVAQGRTFQDWYSACSEADTSCRADTFIKGDNNPIGFDYRVSWLRETPADSFKLVFNPLYLPVAEGSAITMRVNGQNSVRLNDGTGYRRAADERYVVASISRNLALMDQMRAGSSMILTYNAKSGEEVSLEVSLLGLTASLQHIENLRPSQETAAETEETPVEEPEEDAAEEIEEPSEEPTSEDEAPQEPEETETATKESAAEESPTEESEVPEEDEVATIRLDAEWPDDLFLFEAAVTMCLEKTEYKPTRVGVAWVLDAETVAVKLEPWQGELEICLAAADGGSVKEIRALQRSDSAPDSGPTFSPIEFGKPEGCYTHEPVALEDGTPIGWLSEEGC